MKGPAGAPPRNRLLTFIDTFFLVLAKGKRYIQAVRQRYKCGILAHGYAPADY